MTQVSFHRPLPRPVGDAALVCSQTGRTAHGHGRMQTTPGGSVRLAARRRGILEVPGPRVMAAFTSENATILGFKNKTWE